MKKMRAAILHGKEDLRIEHVQVPQIEEGEILLKIEVALTCGTDLKVFRRGYHAKMLKPPMAFGHEGAGVVVESRTKKFKEGDRVVVANSAPCGKCYYCHRRQENLCDDLQFINGTYAEYFRIPERFVEKNAYKIPDKLSYLEAAMTEPLACVVHGIHETDPKKSDVVAVIGLGPIGLMFVGLLKHQGVKVIGVGRHQSRIELAYKLGVDDVIEADENGEWVSRLKKERLDVVIEATGRPEIWELAVDLVRKGGVVNLFGGCPAGTKVQLDTNRLHYDQITLKSSFHHRPSAIQAALDAISSGVIPAKHFISKETRLDELPGVFTEMMKTKNSVKTGIIP